MRSQAKTIGWMAYGVSLGVLVAWGITRQSHAGTVGFVTLLLLVVGIYGYFAWGFSRQSENTLLHNIVVLPFAPAFCVIGVISICLIMLPLFVLWPVFLLAGFRAERQFRRRLKSQGRYITAQQIQPRLEAGEGSLVSEQGRNGPCRVWWTEDDLSALGEPAAMREEIEAILLGGEHPFNTRCLVDYLDISSGKGIATSIKPLGPRQLNEVFPRMRVVRVINPKL